MGSPRAINLAGQRFGFLTVLRRGGRAGRNAAWLCRCICGFEREVGSDCLRSGRVKSCGRGHYNRPFIKLVAGDEYRLWYGMHQRCYNKRNAAFRYYGKRGVRVHDRWHRFDDFLSDMGPRPSPKHSIDRYPDRAGNYAPGNCRWATKKEQGRNTSRTLFIRAGGKEFALADIAEKLGLTGPMVRKRLNRGWSLEEALSVPERKYRNSIAVKIDLDKL